MSDRRFVSIILLACLGMVGLQVWARARPTPEDVRSYARSFKEPLLWRERLAPDFELSLLDGSRFRLSDEVGRKVVVLNFFATWCAPCRAEMPELQRFQNEHGREHLVLLGIDAEEKHTVVEQFVAALNLTFPVGIDGAGDLLKLYDVDSFPTTVVIGADGRVKLYETGAISNADVALGPVVGPELAAIREGGGIQPETYREALAASAAEATSSSDAGPLEGRAGRISEAMPCPCGCSDNVSACRCRTATGIKKRLAQGGYDDKTDVEVMEELNREFCMKGM